MVSKWSKANNILEFGDVMSYHSVRIQTTTEDFSDKTGVYLCKDQNS